MSDEAPSEMILTALPDRASLPEAENDDRAGVVEGDPERGEEAQVGNEPVLSRVTQDEEDTPGTDK